MGQIRLFIVTFCFSVVACSSPQDLMDVDPADSNERLKVVTDLSKCQGGPLPKSIIGEWEARMAGGGVQVFINFRFYQDEVVLKNTCERNGVALTVAASGPYYNYGRQLRFLKSSSDRKSFNDGKIRLNCSARISEGVTNYSFSGRCLKLHVPDQGELVLIPQDGTQ